MGDEKILIDKMFTGRYIDDWNNIGHEIIYYFKPDNEDKSCIYITPYGYLKDGRGENIKYVLLASAKKNGKYQIFSKVEVSKLLVKQNKDTDKYIYKNKYSNAHYEQILKYKFGGKYLYDIYKQDFQNDDAVYATYEVEKIYTVKQGKSIIIDTKYIEDNNVYTKIEICGKEEGRILHNKKDGNKNPLNIGQKNYIYISEGNEEKEIKKIIDKEQIWKEMQVNEYKEDNDIDYEITKEDKIISIIGKETDELVYSNMLYYYFNAMYNGKILFNYFLDYLKNNFKGDNKKILEKINEEFNVENIEKEKSIHEGRIDLYAKNNDINIVIENKINSMINGKEELGKQLRVYNNYYENINSEDFLGIIFVPNYNEDKIYSDPGFSDKEIREKYIVVNYKFLYNFFNDNKKEEDIKKEKFVIEKEKFKDSKAKDFFEDFKDALYIHTVDNEKKEFAKLKKSIDLISKENIKYNIFVLQVCNEKTNNKNKYYVGLTNNYDKRKKELMDISLPKENKKSRNDEDQEENKNKKGPQYNYLDKNNELNIINENDILEFDNLQDAFDARNELEDYISEKYKEIEKMYKKDINNKIEEFLKRNLQEKILYLKKKYKK